MDTRYERMITAVVDAIKPDRDVIRTPACQAGVRFTGLAIPKITFGLLSRTTRSTHRGVGLLWHAQGRMEST
jgi:hypothetical protein